MPFTVSSMISSVRPASLSGFEPLWGVKLDFVNSCMVNLPTFLDQLQDFTVFFLGLCSFIYIFFTLFTFSHCVLFIRLNYWTAFAYALALSSLGRDCFQFLQWVIYFITRDIIKHICVDMNLALLSECLNRLTCTKRPILRLPTE